jgi:hypothetical protein
MAISATPRPQHPGKKLGFAAIILLLILTVAQVPKTQASTSSSQDKALSFLSDVMQLDMAKYTVTLTDHTQPNAGEEFLDYRLDAFLESQALANFFFFNGNLGWCNLNPSLLLYSQPNTDSFNVTLGIIQRYQKWTNDSQVKEMIKLLENVGSQRNATETSGNLTLRISVLSYYTEYRFSNTFNGVDYTGLTLTFSKIGYVYFDDSRAYKTIGDTTIRISKVQAITIAENYVKNYSFTHTFGNGTKIIVSNLNVTGVAAISLGTRIYNPNDNATSVNSTLSPYWHVQVNVSNMPAPGLAGVAVEVSANDGSVASSILVGKPFDFSKLWNPLPYLTAMLSALAIIVGIILVATSLLVFNRKSKKQQPKQTSA